MMHTYIHMYVHVLTIHSYVRMYIYTRVSFRKMVKGGQNNTYKINGGGKGSARDSAPSRGA